MLGGVGLGFEPTAYGLWPTFLNPRPSTILYRKPVTQTHSQHGTLNILSPSPIALNILKP